MKKIGIIKQICIQSSETLSSANLTKISQEILTDTNNIMTTVAQVYVISADI